MKCFMCKEKFHRTYIDVFTDCISYKISLCIRCYSKWLIEVIYFVRSGEVFGWMTIHPPADGVVIGPLPDSLNPGPGD